MFQVNVVFNCKLSNEWNVKGNMVALFHYNIEDVLWVSTFGEIYLLV